MTKHYILSLGLLLELNAMKTAEALKKLAGSDKLAFQFYMEHRQTFDPLRDQFNQGKIDEVTFMNSIRAMIGRTEEEASDEQIRNAWNAMIQIPEGFQADWERLNKQGNVYLISDSNPMHKEYLKKQGLTEVVEQCAYSFERKKSNTELYKEMIGNLDDEDEVFVVLGAPNGPEKARLEGEIEKIKTGCKEQNIKVQFIEEVELGIKNVCSKLEGFRRRYRI